MRGKSFNKHKRKFGLKTIGLLIYFLFLFLLIAIFVFYLFYIMFFPDLQTPDIMNNIALVMAFLSLPTAIKGIVEIFTKQDHTKGIKFEGQCPSCFEKTVYYFKRGGHEKN
ncbi:hypothetical protein EV213_1345 [Aureibacillus halotolerans]|uniref:Uncharacterized protein n=1 Tax=Aureibacillus halotolerans TaxID=1508390 RepID=A0A4R6TL25_9BACI|nr:hypothetical protein EV213_1345 [Aureibacillus halotolerans]